MDKNSPDAPIITHVSDTALWVAVYRAMESKQKEFFSKLDSYFLLLKRGER